MGDPYDDYDRYEAEQYRWEQKRPVCAYCKQHILDDHAYQFDGSDDIVCPDCLEDYLKAHEDIMLDLAVERAEEWYEIMTENKEEQE